MIKHDTMTQDLKTRAQELGEDARDAVRAEADRATAQLGNDAADRVTNAANAAHAAGREFDSDSLQARTARQIADQVEGIAAHLRTADLNSVTRDVSTFARRNPALFIGAAALLGFAATRFLKARDPQRVDYGQGEPDPWGAAPSVNSASRGHDVTS